MFLKFKHLWTIKNTFEDHKDSWTSCWEIHFYKFKASDLDFDFKAMPSCKVAIQILTICVYG